MNSNKQDKSDNNLSTTNKTVVGGINELNTNKSKIDNFSSKYYHLNKIMHLKQNHMHN